MSQDEIEEALSRERPAVARQGAQSHLLMIGLLSAGAVALLAYINLGGESKAAAPIKVVDEAFPRLSEAPKVVLPPVSAPPVVAQLRGPEARVERTAYDAQRELELMRSQMEEREEWRREAERRRRSPVVVVDNSKAEELGQRNAVPSVNGPILADFGGPLGAVEDEELSGPERFASRAGAEGVETSRVSWIADPGYTITQGTLIKAVLETAVQSDLPGFARAQVSEDVYSFDSSKVLIPKGSKLIGKYQSGLRRGQSRVFVIWQRVIRPDGASIQIGSPGTDELGAAGLPGELDTHFFERFGASFLLSLIDGGLDVAKARAADNDNSTIINEGGQGFSRASEIALENSVGIPPTVRVDVGAKIQAFVARDLDFRDRR